MDLLTTNCTTDYHNPSIIEAVWRDIMKGVNRGSIRCNKCGIAMKEGKCPQCGKINCHINIYWQGKTHKFYKDTRGIELSQLSAAHMLSEINREMADTSRPFYIDKWKNAACKQRVIEKAVDLWIADCKEQVARGEMSLSVPILYRSMAKTHFLNDQYGIGKKMINEVGVFEIKQFSKALPSDLKISSRRAIMNNLHVFFTWCYKEGLISSIPAFPTVKGNNSRPRVALTTGDQYMALEKLPEYIRDVYEFEFNTGIRPGETCALKIRDIDFLNKTATIRATFTMGKFRDSDKEGHKQPIPLSERAIEIARLRAAGRFPEDWLFLNNQGTHYSVETLRDTWSKHSGTPITHYEATRHSFCTQIVEVADKKVAKALMRHVSDSSTDRYIHARTEYLREHLEKRGDVVELKRRKEIK